MWAGSTTTFFSGKFMGAHQKVDRIARRALKEMLTEDHLFPPKKLILHFEGKNGPDAIKRKSSGRDEPWHYYDPYDPEDGELIGIIEEHFNKLVNELKAKNIERAGFEASWLSHALLDGLTPSHHYPFEQELERIRGEGKETRNTIFKKAVIKGKNKSDTIAKNWEVWGVKGLIITHFFFEIGAATVMMPMPAKEAYPSRYDVRTSQHLGLSEYFKRIAREIATENLYERFYSRGWTPGLAKAIRQELAPRMAKIVTLAWYMAAKEAGIASSEV